MSSKREEILANIETTLAGITTANGYNFDVKEVSRKFIAFSQTQKFPTLIILAGDERLEPQTNLEYTAFFEFGILGYVKAAKDIANEGLLSKELEKLIQDVKKALVMDVHRGHPEYVGMTWLRRVGSYADWDNTIGIFELIGEVEYFYEYSQP